ncbi:hypothetical protein EVAR_68214_1 [Eumeta japonica]|uniref:Secreted protein n=1 Tax=Eumeta variegata TaxID=151549 RepID=A0A4C1ZZE3_EUMVA|nr:hypothetical protein EVAR_68214_1 [Eumeta japonica]
MLIFPGLLLFSRVEATVSAHQLPSVTAEGYFAGNLNVKRLRCHLQIARIGRLMTVVECRLCTRSTAVKRWSLKVIQLLSEAEVGRSRADTANLHYPVFSLIDVLYVIVVYGSELAAGP